MPNGGTAGQSSTLGAIAAKAQQARAIRTRLNMDAPNGAPSGGMQSSGPTSPEAGLGPADQTQPQGDGQPQDINAMVEQAFQAKRPQLEAAYDQHFGGNGGPSVPPAEPDGPIMQGPAQYMQPESQPLTDRLQKYGSMSASPVEQFATVAGRLPSPQELTVFNARNTLESQLGRPPTTNELKMKLIQPDDESQSFPRAFESPAGPPPGA